jgi:hypothetical protein
VTQNRTCSVRVTVSGGASTEANERVASLIASTWHGIAEQVFGMVTPPASKPRRSRRKHP